MTDINNIKDTLNLEEHDIKKLPSTLNVLTILTYIGSALGIISAIYSYFTTCKQIESLDQTSGSLNELGGALGKMMDGALQLVRKQCDNRLLILIITLAGCALCIWGAIQMRNLKKNGFNMYAIGELLPPIIMIFILGSGVFSGFLLLTSLLIPVLFTVLYFTQRKHLVN